MDKELEKKNKRVNFIAKWLLIGVVLFFVVQLTALGIINIFIPEAQRVTEKQNEEYRENYIGHWYDGTYFINMTVKENFESQEKYNQMKTDIKKDVVDNIAFYGGGICLITMAALFVIVVYRDKKKKLLTGNTPIFIICIGLIYLLEKIFESIDLSIETSYYANYSKGFLETTSYYPQVYFICVLPVLLIALGLVFRQKQRKDLKLDTEDNEKNIKVLSSLILIVGLTFILYRFGVRVYELFSGDVIRIPYYYYIFDLPKNYASTPDAYTKIVILRFFKDLPTFIASAISVVLFSKILKSSIKGKLLSKENDKRYKIIFISLIVASLVLNIVGIFEVKLFNAEFLYQYKEATYTLAIRSLSEPILFVLFLYGFKHYTKIGYILNKSKEK